MKGNTIPPNSSITGASPSDYLVSQSVHLLVCVCAWGVLPFSRDAVGIFYSSNRLFWDGSMPYPGLLLEESYLSAAMQSVYSTAPTDWAEMVQCHIQDTRWRNLTPQQLCSLCFLQPQPIVELYFSIVICLYIILTSEFGHFSKLQREFIFSFIIDFPQDFY